MRKRTKLTATCAVTAVSAVSLTGIPAASANIVEEPLINEFVTDTQGSDMLEYVEILVPDTYDTSDLHIIGVEGDQNSNQGTAVHSYPLGDLDVDDDGRLLLTAPNNGLQNGSLTNRAASSKRGTLPATQTKHSPTSSHTSRNDADSYT